MTPQGFHTFSAAGGPQAAVTFRETGSGHGLPGVPFFQKKPKQLPATSINAVACSPYTCAYATLTVWEEAQASPDSVPEALQLSATAERSRQARRRLCMPS